MAKQVPRATPPTSPMQPTFRQFIELVREDKAANLGGVGLPGFQALFVHRLGVYRMTLPKTPYRKLLSLLYRGLNHRVRNHFSIELSHTAHVGRRVRIIHQGAIVIHPHAVIGDDCWIRQGVTLGTAGDWDEDDHPVLGRDVRLGVGAVLAGTMVVGDGARIGPNAVVTSDVPEGATVVAPRPRVFQMKRADEPGSSSL
jgi:serine O-acetyltransferase